MDSSWNRRDQTLNPIGVPILDPDDNYRPCQTPIATPNAIATPWISVKTEEETSNDLEQGQREYYYACNFPDPATLTAQLIGPGGPPQRLDVRHYLPIKPNIFQVTIGQPQGVVVWNAICDKPLPSDVPYTLIMEDRQGGRAELKFKLKSTTRQRILAIPQAGSPGTTFQVYYCGYIAKANENIEIDLFYDITTKPGVTPTAVHATSWNVFINQDGQGKQSLPSLSTDPIGRYLLRAHDPNRGIDVVWLLPGR
ncbi:MAG: hypothetical protein HYR94_19040 [Chloroflexi bacterium]|nr:hypothetical protein [Chloroflexota bacterium]